MAQAVKNLSQISFLGWKDPLEVEMATHFRILSWEIPWTESLVGYSPWGCKESDMTEQLTLHTLLSMIWGKQGNWRWEGPLGTPLGLVHWKRASSPVEAGTAGYL